MSLTLCIATILARIYSFLSETTKGTVPFGSKSIKVLPPYVLGKGLLHIKRTIIYFLNNTCVFL